MCRSGAKYPGIRPPHSSRVYFLSIILHCPLCIHILNIMSSLSLLCTHVILWSLLCQICLLIGQHRRIKEFRKLFSLITLWLSRSWKKGRIKKKNPNSHFGYQRLRFPSLPSTVHVQLLGHVWLFCKPMGSSVHGISQARILEWVAISLSRESSQSESESEVRQLCLTLCDPMG